MKKFFNIALAMIATLSAFMFTSCDEGDIKGKWTMTEKSVQSLLGNSDMEGFDDLQATMEFDEDILTMALVMSGEPEDGMRMTVNVEVKFDYEKSGNRIKASYKKCTAEVTKFKLSGELKSAVEEQGLDEDYLLDLMNEEIGSAMSSEMKKTFDKDDYGYIIKELTSDKLVLESDDEKIVLTR